MWRWKQKNCIFQVLTSQYEIDNQENEMMGDVEKYFQSSHANQKDIPMIRVYEDSGSDLPQSDQPFENGEAVLDDLGLEKLRIQSVHSDGRATSWSHTDDNNSQNMQYLKRPRTRQQLSNKIVESNQELFNVHYAKSLYTSKISQLVDKQISTNPRSNRVSKSQQKVKKKSSQQLIETSDQSEQNEQKSFLQSGGEMSEDRLARNRVAARNSRARKRLYFELLENKVKDLQDEIDRLNELCQNQAKQIQKYRECKEDVEIQILPQYQFKLETQRKLIEQLEVCQIKEEDSETTKIVLDQLKECQLNSEKNTVGYQYIENLLEILLPIELRYIAYSSDENKDLLSDFQGSFLEWTKETYQLMDIQKEQFRKIRKHKEKLNCVKKNITSCINNLYTSVGTIINETLKVDSIWKVIYESLEPLQLRSLLLTIYQNKHRSVLDCSNLFSDCKYFKQNSQSQNDSNCQRPANLRQYVKKNN
ncbi:unnamed protein product (macronuclear) [Paramecium tetraurelia]|uniref:BZIP domain-containing protein n=1 Tax=Paramecium tetraurelia TaxID=5888 RepID=A0C385_PARTE|nr:uncharacterized protein GSPATT00034730001 [Paramecium tetraurelia]CAK65252.1 unnamed protein product [Paramecium tetraurelia]|eukprot:XP_001432649.1 hypothetical protein (macronuclear) [Paramecium tetraurelia strain d4-2]